MDTHNRKCLRKKEGLLAVLLIEMLSSGISQEFTGGISNHLYGYYIDGEFHEDVVLFRMEEEGKELMVDKNRERRNMQVWALFLACYQYTYEV